MAAPSNQHLSGVSRRRRLGSGLATVVLALFVAGCETSGGGSAPRATVTDVQVAAWLKLIELGDASRDSGELTTALQFYRQAHMQAPEEPLPLVSLGETLIALEDPRGAAGAFRAALDLQPGNTPALLGLGGALIRLDQPLAALQQYEIALNQNPDTVRALSGAGIAADLAGETERAQGYMRRGLEQQPDNVTLLNNLGYSLILSGDYREAIALLEMATALPDSTAQHRQNLALAYGLAGRDAEAARMIRMDFGEGEVDRNLIYYRTRRSRLPAPPAESRAPLPLRNPLAQAAPLEAAPIESVLTEGSPVAEPTESMEAATLELGDFLVD